MHSRSPRTFHHCLQNILSVFTQEFNLVVWLRMRPGNEPNENWSVPIFLGLSDRPKKKIRYSATPPPPPKFIVNNRTEALKTNINLFFTITICPIVRSRSLKTCVNFENTREIYSLLPSGKSMHCRYIFPSGPCDYFRCREYN